MMLKKIRRTITINGVKTWISADTEQEYAEKLLRMFGCSNTEPKVSGHDFEKYAWDWYNIFSKPNVSYVTGLTYRRQLQYHILPLFYLFSLRPQIVRTAARIIRKDDGTVIH